MPTYMPDPDSRARLRALWKPEYDTLAAYNSRRANGVVHTQEFEERMAEIKRDYDENYRFAAAEIQKTAKYKRMRWFST